MPHLDDVPAVETHPEDCCCFVCYCIRLKDAKSKAEKIKNKKLSLV